MVTITLAGASGDVGKRILRDLIKHGATVNAIVRPGKDTSEFTKMGAKVVEANFDDIKTLSEAMKGTQTVVSALSGTREVIVAAQTALLKAAVEAKVPRIVPSDFSIDYTTFEKGRNRNFDWRREFWDAVDAAPIKGTAIFNGAFDYLLPSPYLVDSKAQQVHFWGDDENIRLDFSNLDDVAAYTAQAAIDSDGPGKLHIASISVTPRELAEAASKITGKTFKTQSSGSLEQLRGMIKQMRDADPAPDSQVMPPWQGMMYLENMYSGHGYDANNDNDRYPVHWKTLEDILAPLKGQ